MMRGLFLCTLCLLAACGTSPAWPDLPATGTDTDASPPALVPLGPILAQAQAMAPQDPSGSLNTRMAALDARANALHAPVITESEAARLAPGQLQ